MSSRAERTAIGDWWLTIDRWLLGAVVLLMACGIVFGLAASPAVAAKIGQDMFHFVNKQAFMLLPAIGLMLFVSFLSPHHVRRLALFVFICALGGVIFALFFGAEIKGARRWIFGLQPSEFLKPAFVILAAWAFAEGARRKDMPGNLIAVSCWRSPSRRWFSSPMSARRR